MKKLFFLFLFLFYHLSYAGENKTIHFLCPTPSAVKVIEQSGSWAPYQYQAITPIDLPEIGGQLMMTGEGDSDQVSTFHSFVWTDSTVLCNYDFESKAVVIFETVLSQYVSRCYFQSSSGKEMTYCDSNDPEKCPISCDLA